MLKIECYQPFLNRRLQFAMSLQVPQWRGGELCHLQQWYNETFQGKAG